MGNSIKIAMGLGDDLRIVGLPIDGNLIIVNLNELNVCDLCTECLVLNGTLQCLGKGATILLKKLWDYIEILQHIAVYEGQYVMWTTTLIRYPYIEPNPEEIDQDKLDRLRQFLLLKEWHKNLFDGAKKVRARHMTGMIIAKFRNLVEADVE
ncbi:Vacuolar protein sorting-associated protein-like protein [Corchorus olitorius]|uniref:Vacuolar protein sorting-associated protein-like protein n=1 Tax=Corchorus olitorius TaxID=93759 RepID=A0A1R3L4L2_9ROSI|nr:Vacuolar protein sorting-associated protein-like protein [Corchorus olitorius]